MWVLECEGDVLQNKKIWLRPGKKYLFGRTKTDNGGFAIDNKSISRKHLTISIAQVEPGDGSKIRSRSRITIKDQGSKFGTLINGKQIKGESEILQGDDHEIQLGTFQPKFHIRWRSVVFSFSFSSKEQKNKDPLVPIRSRLEPLDIKTVIPFIIGTSTHVVATKRNTAKGLQALINARYIVTDSYVDAVVNAAQTPDPDDPESLSPLEADFDAVWPDPLQYLPPQGKEPTQRPSAFFAPNPSRTNVFEGYTFVFCDRTQFENLQPPITNGGGKALMYELEHGTSTAEQLVKYIKSVAGEKDTGRFADGSEGQGVVLVRFRGKKGTEDWSIELGNDVARALDQRVIEQSEFLDAILTNDASRLRRPLPEDDGATAIEPQQPTVAPIPDTDEQLNHNKHPASASIQPSGEATEALTKRNRSRRLIRSQFKGFDDGFDPSSIPPAPNKFAEESSQPQDRTDSNLKTNKSDPLGSEDVQKQRPRKRPLPMSEEESEEEAMDRMFPAAAAMKRRRIAEQEEEGREAGTGATAQEPKAAPLKPPEASSHMHGTRRSKKEIDVLAVAREHREAEDEAATRDEELMRAANDGVGVEEMRNLAVIEEMPVRARSDRRPAHAGMSEVGDQARWDDRWNGRKNFKKFRRRGNAAQIQSHQSTSIIVGLEEVKGRGLGFGNEAFIGREKEKRHKENRPSDTRPSTRPPTARNGSLPSETSFDDVMEVTAPKAAAMATTNHAETTNTNVIPPALPPNEEVPSSISRTAPGKRPVSRSVIRSTPPKKQKMQTKLFERNTKDGGGGGSGSSSDEEDELRFRFNRRQ